jgi:hypothetical protein
MKTSMTSLNKDCEKISKISKKAYNKTNKKISNKLLKEVKELSDELSSKFKTTGEYLASLEMPRRKRNKKNKQKALTNIKGVFASCSPKVEAEQEEFGFNPVGKKEYYLNQDEYEYECEDDEYNIDQDDKYDLDFEI